MALDQIVSKKRDGVLRVRHLCAMTNVFRMISRNKVRFLRYKNAVCFTFTIFLIFSESDLKFTACSKGEVRLPPSGGERRESNLVISSSFSLKND